MFYGGSSLTKASFCANLGQSLRRMACETMHAHRHSSEDIVKNESEDLPKFDELTRTIRTRITLAEHDPMQLAFLLDAMRGFKEGDLSAVVRTRDGKQFAHYSQPVADMDIHDKEVAKLLKDCGVRLKGEVCYIRFDRRKERVRALEARVLAAVGLEMDDDPVAKGWRPPYWYDPEFLAALDMPCIDYLGRVELVGWHSRSMAYMMHDPHWSDEPRHYMGSCMRFLRNECSASGKLSAVRLMLQRCNSRVLWPTALVPPDWQAPEGAPESWTRELVRMQAEEERDAKP